MTQFDSSSSEWPDAELQAELRLTLTDGVGPLLRRALLERFGSARAVFEASPADLREVPGIGPKIGRAIFETSAIDLEPLITECHARRIELIGIGSQRYPRELLEIPDPPGILFVRGNLLPEDRLAIAIVGTRHASHYGLRQAQNLAAALARAGLTIISGLARGIDGAAHGAALEAGGRTIAVLANGLEEIYPPEHTDLAEAILQSGALVSENPPHAIPIRGAFPRRNRIITGLSLGVIVVEAAKQSGALISARHAMEQNRDVFAVPGRIDSRVSQGCHQLIRDGATLVESADDVLEQLGPLVESVTCREGQTVHHPAELQLNDQERAVLEHVHAEPTSLDYVVEKSGLPVHRTMSTIVALEMRRLIRRVEGAKVIRL